MKILIVFLTIILTISILPAQDRQNSFDVIKQTNFLLYMGQTVGSGSRTDLAIGMPLYDNNFYYGFYLNHHPGIRLEYRLAGSMIIGLSIRDDHNRYYPTYYQGFKLFRYLRIGGAMSLDKTINQDFSLELVFSVN